MMAFSDQMGHTIRLPTYPRRIISLVPSQTELLFDLGLDEEIVGVTDYCIAPKEKVAQRAKVGGPKAFRFEMIDALRPDVIIGNKEENYAAGIRRLQERYPVWMSDIVTVEDALVMIQGVGALINRRERAKTLIADIRAALEHLPEYPPMRVAYLIWKAPFMVAGGHTFINDMLKYCGFVNIFEARDRYPQVASGELGDAELILLSSEPYPFSDEDVGTLQRQYPTQRVRLVDGTMFSWYGSRLKYAPAYFRALRRALAEEG